ncbi:hypothetical protein NE471_27405, partial [Escherichia coli]
VQPRLSMENTTVTADNNVEKNVASLAANAGTLFNRLPLHADINHLIGDFTALTLLEIDMSQGAAALPKIFKRAERGKYSA